MSFGFTAYLLGFAFLAVPIILHLLKLRPTVVEKFPSFYFLSRKIVRRQRRNSILKYLILLCRCAALSLFALAFAWPYWSNNIALKADIATVIILDNSFSTEAKETQEILTNKLNYELKKISSTRPALGAVVSDTVIWSNEFTADSNALGDFFQSHTVSPMSSDFLPALYQADSYLGKISATQKRVVIITDRQELPWQHIPETKFLRHTDVITVLPESVSIPYNYAVTDSKVNENLELSTTIANFSNHEVELMVNQYTEEKLTESRAIVLMPNSEKVESFQLEYPNESQASFCGKVELTEVDDAVKIDNCRYFTVNPIKETKIFLTPNTGEYDFIRTALHGKDIDELNADTVISETPALYIVRNNVDSEQLEQALSNGSSVVLVYNSSREMRDIFTHFNIKIATKLIDKTGLEMVNFEHPIFNDYLNVSIAPWFAISFNQVPKLTLPSNARVLATFYDNNPAIAELNYGGGKLFILATPIETSHTNFQTYGTFLPFWRELLHYASTNVRRESDFIVSSAQYNQVGIFNQDEFLYSVNVDPRESVITQISENQNYNQLLLSRNTQDEPANTIPKDKKNYSMILLLLGLIFVVTETLISNRTVH